MYYKQINPDFSIAIAFPKTYKRQKYKQINLKYSSAIVFFF